MLFILDMYMLALSCIQHAAAVGILVKDRAV